MNPNQAAAALFSMGLLLFCAWQNLLSKDAIELFLGIVVGYCMGCGP